MKIKIVTKIILILIASIIFLALTKIKIAPILGTQMKFSLSAFFGPTLAKIFGIEIGTGVIVFTHLLGLALGFYKIKAVQDFFTFLPIILGGIYFTKVFKGDKKLFFLPLICILLFILNPIGRTVWFYSGFWLIPIFISLFKEKIDKIIRLPVFKIYGYALGAAFIDHAIGSVIYLYLLKIPSQFWIAAIPLTILERLILAAGIELCYLTEIILIKVFNKIPFLVRIKEFALD